MVLYTVFNGEYQRIIRLHFRGSATYPAKRPSPFQNENTYSFWKVFLYTLLQTALFAIFSLSVYYKNSFLSGTSIVLW